MENSNKPVYPGNTDHQSGCDMYYFSGLTKREYFAGLAMQGLMSLPYKGDYESLNESCKTLAYYAIKQADELLKQLENG